MNARRNLIDDRPVGSGEIFDGQYPDMAKGLGIKVTAGDIDLFDAANAEEMFLTSTSLCILPVKSFNGGPVADGKTPGPITKKLIDAYSKDVGCDFVGQYLKFLN